MSVFRFTGYAIEAEDEDEARERLAEMIAQEGFLAPVETGTYSIEVNVEEMALLASALDSHVYWQLSDTEYRDSGYVQDPGSDDPETSEEIQRAEALQERLEALIPPEMRVG